MLRQCEIVGLNGRIESWKLISPCVAKVRKKLVRISGTNGKDRTGLSRDIS